MSKTSLFSLLSVAALSLGLTVSAGATTIVITPGAVMPTAPINFDTNSTGFTFTGTFAGIVTGNSPNVYAQPVGDATAYAYVGSGSMATYTNAAGFNTFGLYWGSPDQYNTLAFYNGATLLATYGNGGMPVGSLTPNYQSNVDSYVMFSGLSTATSAVFTSSAAAFEFDNVAASFVASPEPASIALLAGGLLAIGAGAIRRRKA